MSKIRTRNFKSGPVRIVCILKFQRAPAARRTELTFTVRALFAQAIDAFTSIRLARLSVVINEVTGIEALPPPVRCKSWACACLGAGRFRGSPQL